MRHQGRTVAGVEIAVLCDAVGPMGPLLRRPLTEMFPGSAAADFAEDPWVLHFHCYLLRDPQGRTILVDAGIGGTGSPASSWAPVPGRLPDELAAAGVRPEDVDVVVLTHLHSDHVSGATADGRPVFPNARHLVQRAEVAAVEKEGGPVRTEVLDPLRDLLHVVDGDAEVVPGVRVVATPGHTPGHQIVRVGELAMTGDLLHHPVQLADPGVGYVYDDDEPAATAVRKAILDALRVEGGVIATAHFPDPFTPLT
ncbi:MBL fold metallo-hydrolase [Spongiactinospora sp. TRM90649]|uniref:MBL fold metallo-hydrolase n=1 Tax=Spongiactinospora sp. TRM90649 TaxID=3031114 RepID=UPI0023F68FA9|nr:MBL fold metallo-hydrolase [Spongiactinospora sp. TRM90649]MDF5757528.1 MBL fold metallo-hydrolase [Spongiactinospora sp. TRM90649]